jgi:cobalt-zinc-cadmium efflux system outer membrane protein
MRWQRIVFLGAVFSFLWLVLWVQEAATGSEEQPLSLTLPLAIEQALRNNPDLKAKRQALGIAQGRVQQAELLFQDNPHLSMDVDYRHRRFALPTGKSGVDTEVRLLQEIEIAGQRGYRREAAAKNLAQAEWSVADAERLLQWEVTRVFYDLFALQEQIAVRQQMLSTQEALLQAGLTRFERGDISVLEVDTLRLERDRTRSELVSSEEERVRKETQLRLLLGLGEETPLAAGGNLLTLPAERMRKEQLLLREDLEACALEHRPDVKAARLTLERREAELRLAQARRIPNISVGPLYKLDNEDQVIGGTLSIPLPLFNRNQHEITTAMANLQVGQTEVEARTLAVKQEVAAAYARLQLAERRLAAYSKTYIDNLVESGTFARKAYEAGEISIFEFSVTLDRLIQTRFRYLEAVLAYRQAEAELKAQAPSCLTRVEPN